MLDLGFWAFDFGSLAVGLGIVLPCLIGISGLGLKGSGSRANDV